MRFFAWIAAAGVLCSATAAHSVSTTGEILDRFERIASADGSAGWDRAYGFSAAGAIFWIEQSERFVGPQIIEFAEYEGALDVAGERARVTKKSSVPLTGSLFDQNWQIFYEDGNAFLRLGDEGQGAWRPLAGALALDVDQFLWGSPAWLVDHAREASDLEVLANSRVFGAEHAVIRFHMTDLEFTLYFNSDTGLLTRTEIAGAFADSSMLNPWGRSVYTFDYGYYTGNADGSITPKQIDILLNGGTKGHIAFSRVEPVSADTLSFKVPEAVVSGLPKAAEARKNALEFAGRIERLAEGVFMLPGAWNVGVVDTSKGFVLLDAVINRDYMASVVDFLSAQEPRDIVGAITTSTAWPHFGGLPYFIENKVPIHGLALDEPIIRRLANSNGLMLDNFVSVEKPTTVRLGGTVIEIAPIMGLSTERMMAVYLPEARLLYTSDAIQLTEDGQIWNHAVPYVKDVAALVCRQGWSVERVFGMHIGAVKWADVQAQLGERKPC